MSPKNKTLKMKINVLMINSSLCIGCQSCEVACKLEHDMPQGPRPVKIIQVGPFDEGGRLFMTFQAVTCYHCDRPQCVTACPTGAMQKRDDGIVFSDPQLCIGCQTCAVACPYGIPELNPATGKIAKCDGCKDRVDIGLWPACALICPTGAMAFGSPLKVVQDMRTIEAFKILKSLKIES